MKKSYWICSGVLLAIVLAMVVYGFVSDYYTKKEKLKRKAVQTMLSAGCTEREEKKETDGSSALPDGEQLLHGGEDVDLSSLSDAGSMISQLENEDVDGPMIFEKVGNKLLSNAQFTITDTKISGRDAEVTVHIYYGDHDGEVVLEYFYYQGDWMLSNTIGALKDIAVDGKSYDELESSAYETLVDYIKTM